MAPRRHKDAFQATWTFTETRDKDGNTYFISHDLGTDGAFQIDPGRVILMFFPPREGTPSKPPTGARLVLKPRDFTAEDEEG
jgi:hypothetical protein